MKTILTFLFCLLAASAALAQPIRQNPFTTNLATQTARITTPWTLSATNTSNTFGSMQQRMVNTNLYTGAGTLTASIGSQVWTVNGGTIGFEMYGGFIVVNVSHQFKIVEVTDSTHFRTMTVSDANYTTTPWNYYSNYFIFYDGNLIAPNVVATIDGGGGFNVKSFEFANDGGFLLGSGTNWMRMNMRNAFAGRDTGLVIEEDGNKEAYFFSMVASNNTLMTFKNGDIWLGGKLTNQGGVPLAITVQPQFTTGSPSAGTVWTSTDSSGSGAWSNWNGGLTVTSFASAFAPENLGATTNVDGSHTFMFYRSTTNVVIPFQLTNMQSGCSYEIQLFNVGATAATVTLTAATGKTLSTANVASASSLTFGTPTANSCLRILIAVNGNTNRVDFLDNYK